MTPETGIRPSFLPDTNVLIALLNKDKMVEKRLQGMSMHLAGVVLGELYFGVYRSGRVEENLKKLEAFIADFPILSNDKTTAEHYGRIKQVLYAKGRPTRKRYLDRGACFPAPFDACHP